MTSSLPRGRTVVKARMRWAACSEATLVLWLAGNQFFAMDSVIAAFQKQNPGTASAVTLPPGLLLDAIRAGGWHYGGAITRACPTFMHR